MSVRFNWLFKLACASMFSGVALGARYGHQGQLNEEGTALFAKAQLYNTTNCLGLIGCALVSSSSIPLKVAATGFIAGQLFFITPLFLSAILGDACWRWVNDDRMGIISFCLILVNFKDSHNQYQSFLQYFIKRLRSLSLFDFFVHCFAIVYFYKAEKSNCIRAGPSQMKKRAPHIFLAAQFVQQDSKKSLSIFRTKIIAEKLNNPKQWFINQEKYHTQKWKEIFQLMYCFKGQKIIFEWNRAPNIVTDVIHVKFINLKHLSFGANLIESIDSLCKLQAPYLKQLSLCNNQISSFQPLRKCYFPKLAILELFNNRAPTIEAIIQLKSSSLYKLVLEMTQHHPVMCEDLRIVCKLQSKRMKWIWAQGKPRIQSKCLTQILHQKDIGGLLS